MNKNKELVLRICILLGVCSVALGVKPILHKDYNESKLIDVKEIINIPKMDSYEEFMKIVDESKTRLIKKEHERKMQENNKKVQDKAKINKEVSASRGNSVDYDTTFICSFYSGLNCENSKHGAIGSRGVKLFDGVVASNVISYGTYIKLQGWGAVQVLDSGGSHFDSPNRLDIYVPRIEGESDNQYYKRVQKLGKIKIQGKIIK
jgi:3D (Asp-Asp-Asp) domain-containing protein